MSAHEANNPFDLLQLNPPQAPLSATADLGGAAEPQLDIDWRQFHQGLASNFVELFRLVRPPKGLLSASFFRDTSLERRIPRRAIFAAALWHVAFMVLPFPQIAGPKRNHAFDNAEVTWSGPIEDFPLISAPAHKLKPVPRGVEDQPPAPDGADAFHPRQRVFTDPSRPNHPRQTLIQPAAPPEAPKLLPNLPNMVQLAQSAQPLRPRLEISARFLKQLHPKERRVAADPNSAPEVQMALEHSGELPLETNSAGPERPKLQINAGSAPRAVRPRPEGAAEPAPDVANQLASPNGSGQTLIALSPTPGPAAPVAPPAGNLAARMTMSPEGKKPGVPGGPADGKPDSLGSNGTAGAVNSSGISITGGAPKAPSAVSGLSAGKLSMPSSRPNYSRAEAAREEAPAVRSGPPDFAALAPDAKPEAIFARRRVYSLNVNMPNLNSATGSWILNFTEMRTAPSGPSSTAGGEVAEPSPLRKVDPKYPPSAAAENIEGEVILYAVIRRDGSVDSIQLVKGIDPQL
ncbi:MAG TPA: energy transducer TonB, partial [Candidatus Acidoferrum sp.]|nr:energy transducer TonB [Candidatus Acidoferrum sp.]